MAKLSLSLSLQVCELQMASVTDDEESNIGSMWVLNQKLDQPMEEEAVTLKNMYREKVPVLLFLYKSYNYFVLLFTVDSRARHPLTSRDEGFTFSQQQILCLYILFQKIDCRKIFYACDYFYLDFKIVFSLLLLNLGIIIKF